MRPDWDNQFAETEDEKRERWRATKAKRIAAGQCWQCAKPVRECRCPNIQHPTQHPGFYMGDC